MSQTRRDFLWTMGAATGGVAALQGVPDVLWSPEPPPDEGWTPGIEERLTSTCLICPARCGITGRVVDGRLVRIVGNPLHPTSRGGVCPRGVGGVQILYHPERLAGPLVRDGERGSGQWRRVTRDEAIGVIAERLSTIRGAGRPEAVAVLAGSCPGSMEDVWRQFLRAYGSPNYVADDYRDGTDRVMELVHGIRHRPAYDLRRAELVVSFGAPLFEAWWSPLQAFVAFAEPRDEDAARPRFIQVDTRFSRSAARAHEWVGIRPGTYGMFALGLAYVLLRDRLIDEVELAERVAGFSDTVDARGRTVEGYRSHVLRHYRSEEVSAATGVSIERIRSLARSLVERKPVIVCGREVMLAPDGLLAGLAVHSLNILLGSVNRPGGVLVGEDPPLTPLPDAPLDAVARAALAASPVTAANLPFDAGAGADRLATALAGEGKPPVEALFVYQANPLASSTRRAAWEGALEKIPFLVSFSPFLDETAERADVILPDLLPWERWQDGPTPASDPLPVWGIARPLVEPHEGGTHTGDAVLRLASELGGGVAEALPYESFEALLKVRAKGLFEVRRGMVFGDDFERRNRRQMEERGWWLPTYGELDEFWDDLVARGGWTDPFLDTANPSRATRTADGRPDLMPEALIRALRKEDQGRRPYVDVSLPRPSDAEQAAGGKLRLLPYRLSTLASGTLSLTRWLVEDPGLYPDLPWFPWVEVAPETARSRGLSEGTLVRLTSDAGSYRARLKVHPGIAPGTVCAPYRLRHPDGESANPLHLLDGTEDPLTGLPAWFTTFVRLEKA
ncbi:MAG: molybdopterin-dependent oxidoreductase [Gemmatimonadota bacterium]